MGFCMWVGRAKIFLYVCDQQLNLSALTDMIIRHTSKMLIWPAYRYLVFRYCPSVAYLEQKIVGFVDLVKLIICTSGLAMQC